MSEALCQCGHVKNDHFRTTGGCGVPECGCTCLAFTPPPTREPIKCPTCGVARGWDKDGYLTRGIWTLNCVRCGAFTIEIDDPDPPTREPIRLTDEERSQMNCDCAQPYDWDDHVDSCFVPAVESILAARLAGPESEDTE